MFPLKASEPYILETGKRSTLGEQFGGSSQDIRDLKDRVTTLEGTVSGLSGDVEKLQNIVEAPAGSAVVDFSSIISIEDALPIPAKDVKLKVEPVQDLHGYDKPWVGGAGDNKLEVTANSGSSEGITFTVASDGVISCNNATSTGVIAFTINSNAGLGPGDYILSGCPSGGSLNTYNVRAQVDGSWGESYVDSGSGVTIHATTGITQVNIQIRSGVNTNGLVFKPMITPASTPDSDYAHFRPYKNICPITGWTGANITVADAETDPTTTNTYIISFGSTYYLAELDVTTGVLTVIGAVSVYDGSEDENWTHPSGWGTGSYYLENALTSAVQVSGYATVADLVSNLGGSVKPSDLASASVDNYGIGQGAGANLYVKFSTEHDTAAKLKTYLSSNNLQVLYKLATPTTVQLTPTELQLLLGYNTLFADTGDLSLTYDPVSVSNISLALADLYDRLSSLQDDKLDTSTLKTATADSSDFADFQSKIAAL